MKFKIIAIYFLIIPFSFNCSSLQKNIEALKKCKVTLNDIRIKNLKSFSSPPGIVFSVLLDIYNPNTFAVELNEFDISISKISQNEKIKLARIKSSAQMKILPGEKKTFEVELETEKGNKLEENLLHALLSTIQDFLKKQNSLFSLDGFLKIDSLFGNISIPLEIQQEVKL